MGIRERKNRGTWTAFVTINGRDITRSAKTQDEALQLEKELLALKAQAMQEKVAQGALKAREAFPEQSLGHAFDLMCSRYPKWMPGPDGRLHGQAQNCQRLIRWLGPRRHPSELTEEFLAAFFDEEIHHHLGVTRNRLCQVDPEHAIYARFNTISKYIYALRKLLEFCQKKPRRWIDEIPELPEMPARKEIPVHSLTIEQVEDIRGLMHEQYGPICAHLIEFCVRTCCRIDEALSLRTRHLIPVTHKPGIGGYVHFEETKNGDERHIPISMAEWPQLSQWLGAGLPGQINDYSDHVFPIHYRSFLDRYQAVIDQLVPRWGWTAKRRALTNVHSLRKTGLTLYAEGWEGQGMQMNLLQLQALGGHKTVAMLRRYVDKANLGNEAIIAGTSLNTSNAVTSVSSGQVVRMTKTPDQTTSAQSLQPV